MAIRRRSRKPSEVKTSRGFESHLLRQSEELVGPLIRYFIYNAYKDSAVKKQKVRKNHFKYKNLTILGIGLLLAAFLYKFELFHSLLLALGSLGYIGAFFAGMLFVSSFTVATGMVILLVLAEQLIPLEIAVLAGIGAVVGDLFIFHFVKDGLISEIQPIFERFGGKHIQTLLHTKYFSWSLPLIGALIIASPLPDEIGVSLMGISKMSTVKFLIVSFMLNSIGIFFIVSASLVLKP